MTTSEPSDASLSRESVCYTVAMNTTTKCKVDECPNPGTFAKGWCGSHYKRWWRHGDPLAGRGGSLDKRLREKGWDETPGGCWEVHGSKHSFGYGKIEIKGKSTSTHRAAYKAWVGEIGDGLHVLHKCDNPPCINPDHLYTGTPRQNVEDMFQRGRTNWNLGELNPSSKLAREQVLAIRSDPRTHTVIARDYGITQSHVSNIKAHRIWRHL